MAGKTAILKVDIVSDYKSKGADQAEQSFDKLHRAALGVSTAIVAGVGVAATKAVKDASALEESVNAVNVVFGDASDTIAKFGETSAQSAGLSQREFNQMATKTGALLQNFGYSADQAAESTIGLTNRAADMASVFDTDVSEAMDAIEAGLRGQPEQLLKYGVSMDAASVKAKALEMGLYDGTGALDAQAKALAVEAIILEQTAGIAGDFANTSDSLANRQRELTASMENVSAQMGQALLPIMETAVGIMSEMVAWIAENDTAFKIIVGTITALAAAYLAATGVVNGYRTAVELGRAAQALFNAEMVKKTALTTAAIAKEVAYKAAILATRGAITAINAATKAWTAVQWLLNAALTANPIGLVIAAVAALVAGFVLAYKNIEPFRKFIDGLWRLLKNSVVAAFNAVSYAIEKMVSWVKRAWEWVQKLIDKIRQVKSPSLKLPKLWSAPVAPAGMIPHASASGAPSPIAPAPGSVTINIAGAIDPVATAEQIRRLLVRQDARMGRPIGVWGIPA